MKQFDIEKAKNGAAVCLRDGTPVKILDFDYNGMVLFKYLSEQETPDGKKEERLGWATINGYGRERYGTYPDKDQDLFMTPVYGYMNVYKNETNKVLIGGVVRATLEECIGAGKSAPMDNLELFCHARVELLDEYLKTKAEIEAQNVETKCIVCDRTFRIKQDGKICPECHIKIGFEKEMQKTI